MITKKLFGYGFLAVILALSLTGCPVETKEDGPKTLSGDIEIHAGNTKVAGDVFVNTELSAEYSGTETVTYQWKKDGGNVGTGANKFTPTQAGSYTVTVSAAGYNPKTSEPVTVKLHELTGDITISPNTDVTTGTQMIAAYSGNETVTYEWKWDGNAIHNATGKTHSPSTAGSYTVTVSAEGYAPKTSDPVDVTGESLEELEGEITFTVDGETVTSASSIPLNKEITAVYSGTEDVTLTYQWNKGYEPIDGETDATFTPTEIGVYTVTVSADGYASITSEELTAEKLLSGTITITPDANGLITGTVLTATYTGNETVTYQWKKGDVHVGTNAATYTPVEGGEYTVTVSADGYSDKTSQPVTVTAIIITFNANNGNWSGSTDNKTAINAEVIGSPIAAPTRDRTTFDGWYTEANGGTKETFSALITTDTTFYARWEYVLPLTVLTDVSDWLTGTGGGIITRPTNGATAASPAPLSVNIALGATSAANSGWENLLGTINTANKYVALDLSASTMTGTEFNNPPAATGKDKIVTLKLPAAATSIAARTGTSPNWFYTFQDYTNLKEVGGAVSIGNFAFANMTSLTNISFPEATSIGNQVFQNCTNLTSVSLPKATSIGSSTFSGCTSLASVNFPEATTINNTAFNNCTSLSSVDFPKVTTLGSSVFSGCTNLESVSFGALLTIPDYLFESSTTAVTKYLKLKTVSFAKATSIGNAAFDGCTSLDSVSFPEATSIGNFAFRNCRLTSVSFPAVQTIGTYAFANMTSLTSVDFPKVTTLGSSVFSGCTNLESVSFGALLSIPDNLFWSSTVGTQYLKLKTVNFPAATSIGNAAFDGCTSLASVSFPEATSIGQMAFQNCTSLTSVSFPAVQTIGDAAFSSTDLTSITIAANVTFGNNGNGGFPEEFRNCYENTNNKAAGTYTRSGPDPNFVWTLQP